MALRCSYLLSNAARHGNLGVLLHVARCGDHRCRRRDGDGQNEGLPAFRGLFADGLQVWSQLPMMLVAVVSRIRKEDTAVLQIILLQVDCVTGFWEVCS